MIFFNRKLIILNSVECTYAFLSYGLSTSLILYLTEILHLTHFEALSSLSIQSCLVYSLPILIAFLSERFIQKEILIFIGLLFMALGFIIFGYSPQNYFTLPLSLITVGYVLGRPNIPLLMSRIVPSDQNGRAISILYAAGNVAYTLAPLIFALALSAAKQEFFLILGLGTFLISLLFFKKFINKIFFNNPQTLFLGIVICLGLIFIVRWLLNAPQRLKYLFVGAVFMALFYFWRIFSQTDAESHHKAITFFLAFLIACLFFSFFSQQYFFMPLYIERYVHRFILGFEIPTPWFNICNPLFVVLLSPILPKFIKKLNTLASIAPVAIGMTGMGFLFLLSGVKLPELQILSIAIAYLCLAIAELILVPFILSFISTWDSENEKSSLMGLLYLSMAFAKIIASRLALLIDFSKDTQNSFSSDDYGTLFFCVGMGFIGTAFFLGFILKYLLNFKRLQHTK